MGKAFRISLVVIGRDSQELLNSIYSADYLAQLDEQVCERIYIDSDSGDSSLARMRAKGFKVLRLLPKGVLSAAAGRWLGTIRARGEYILYLDSDMRLQDPGCLQEVAAEVTDSVFDGVVGEVIDHLPDGSTRKRIRRKLKSGNATSFGGFLLIKRTTVLEAGNWNPALFSNEELDLYARLLRSRSRVRYDEGFVAHHLTGEISRPLQQLACLYLPWKAPRRYGGYGRALASSLRTGSAGYLIRNAPEPLLLLLLLISVALPIPWWVKIGLFALFEGFLLRRRSWKYNFVVPGQLLSLPYGLLAYRPRQVETDDL